MEKLEFEFKGEKYTRHFKNAKEKENYIINVAKEVIFSDGLLEVIKITSLGVCRINTAFQSIHLYLFYPHLD
jgi:hypothetical protein